MAHQPTPPTTSPDIIKTIGKSTQKTLAKLGFGEFPGPQQKESAPTKIKKMQTVGDVLIHEERSIGSPQYLDIDDNPMEKYNSAPPIHLASKQFTVSADELNWTTWQENDDISKLPSLAIQYYEEVRNDQNVKFQGILHKKGQNNKEWKVRIFSMNPDTGFYIRYFTEDSKLEVGYERGSIDVEDIINIETGRADKAGFILISLHTTNRTFELSTQSSKMAGMFVGVVCNMREIITTQISKKVAEDMYRHRDKVLIKGWMHKMGKVHRTWKRRFFVLDTNRDFSIRYWEKQDTTVKPKGAINLVNVNFVQNTQDLNKKRKRATREEVAILRRAFSVNPLPPLEVRSKIAQQLNWTPRKVKIWFQNERAKLRKRTRDCETNVNKDSRSLVDSTSSQDENSDDGSKSPKVHYPSASSSTSIPPSPSPSPVLGGGFVGPEKRMMPEGGVSSPPPPPSISSQLSHPSCVLSSVKINQSAYPFPFHSAMTPFRQWATSGGDQ